MYSVLISIAIYESPQTQQLKKKYIYYVTIFMGQE